MVIDRDFIALLGIPYLLDVFLINGMNSTSISLDSLVKSVDFCYVLSTSFWILKANFD